jgi:glucosamine-phosphate N-acetyltransferase
MNNIHYRQITLEDYDAMYTLMNQFRPNSLFTKEQFQSFLTILGSQIQIWVLLIDNKIVSTAKLILEPKLIFNLATLAHVEDVCTLESERKKGYGKMLMNHLIQVAKEAKCYKITLCCNGSLEQFYGSAGFEQRGIQMSQLI